MSQFTISQMLAATVWLTLACAVMTFLPRAVHPAPRSNAVMIVVCGWAIGACLVAAIATLKGNPLAGFLIAVGTLPIMLGLATMLLAVSR